MGFLLKRSCGVLTQKKFSLEIKPELGRGASHPSGLGVKLMQGRGGTQDFGLEEAGDS